MLDEAMEVTGIPAFGEAHPLNAILDKNLYVISRRPSSTGPNQVSITVIYRQFDTNIEYDGGSTLRTKTTTEYLTNPLDSRNNQTWADMQVEYTYPDDYEVYPSDAGQTLITGVKLSNAEVYPRFSVSRTETVVIGADSLFGETYSADTRVTGEILTNRNFDFAGTLNLAGWYRRPDDGAGVWMCQGIEFHSADSGISYRVKYSFEGDPKTWNPEARFIDPNTGSPPSDLVADTGKKTYKQQPYRDFNLLEIA